MKATCVECGHVLTNDWVRWSRQVDRCPAHHTRGPEWRRLSYQPEVDPVEQPTLFAADMNAVGSDTGRVFREAPDTSVKAARKTNARSQRGEVLGWLRQFGELTSIELVVYMPQMKVSNRVASRLGELWEEGRAAIVREHGTCVLGECYPHNKPGIIHRPTQPCDVHGKPRTRGGASIWTAL